MRSSGRLCATSSLTRTNESDPPGSPRSSVANFQAPTRASAIASARACRPVSRGHRLLAVSRAGPGRREQRRAAKAGLDSWAWEAVEEPVTESDDQVSILLDALLEAPAADTCYLGAGPIEELLVAHGPRWQQDVALRCRTSSTWRAALACVWLNNAEEKQVPLLAEFLPRGEPPVSGEKPSKRVRKVGRDRRHGGRRRNG